MPRLRVLAGPSLEELTTVRANSDQSVSIKSDAFEGEIAVYIKDFADEYGKVRHSEYFDVPERQRITWSLQMQGRFLNTYSSDDILFGNVFDRPFQLPWGFGAAVKFMQFRDPTLEQDLTSKTTPWALSPFISTMPYTRHKRLEEDEDIPRFPPPRPIGEDTSDLRTQDGMLSPARPKDPKNNIARRAWFKKTAYRKDVSFGPDDLLTVDFCHNHLYFSPKGIDLRIPGGIKIDVMRYWDGQPVKFVCCERVRKGEVQEKGAKPWGRVLFCIVIELASEAECETSSGEETAVDSSSSSTLDVKVL